MNTRQNVAARATSSNSSIQDGLPKGGARRVLTILRSIRAFALMLACLALAPGPVRAQLYEPLKSLGHPRLRLQEFVPGSDGAFYAVTDDAILRISSTGGEFVVLHRFSENDSAGIAPQRIIEGSDGALYGVTAQRGQTNGGALFTLRKDGSGFAVLHSFDTHWDERTQFPEARHLLEGPDGYLYGNIDYGGNSGKGVIFRVRRDGAQFSVLHDFGETEDPHSVPTELILGSDGWLYGATIRKETADQAALFKVDTSGVGFAIIQEFPASLRLSTIHLVEGEPGQLYGSAVLFVGASRWDGQRTLFKLLTDGSGFETLRNSSISSDLEAYPVETSETAGRPGFIYGFTATNGVSLFRLDVRSRDFTIIPAKSPGWASPFTLRFGANGVLYGSTAGGGRFGGGDLFEVKVEPFARTPLLEFETPTSDGVEPIALKLGPDGALYGVSYEGADPDAIGSVFRLDRDGSNFRVLHRFSEQTDGAFGWTLVVSSDGTLYGTTLIGGELGGGTVYRLDPNGERFRVLQSFPSAAPNFGSAPQPLIMGKDGDLYGYSYPGGTPKPGAIIAINAEDGSVRTLLDLSPLGVSSIGISALLEDKEGDLYGAAANGGTHGKGFVFKLTKSGTFTILHSFDLGKITPELMEGGDGVLYGASEYGGKLAGGVVFRLAKDGSGFTVLRSFESDGSQSPRPGSLIQWADGLLYGTTILGGRFGGGTMFRLDTNGVNFQVLHDFATNSAYFGTGSPSRLNPGPDGAVYGLSVRGGDFDSGAVFRFFPQASSRLKGERSGGEFKLSLTGIAAATYTFERSTNMVDWRPVREVTSASPSSPSVHHEAILSPRAYYRALRR